MLGLILPSTPSILHRPASVAKSTVGPLKFVVFPTEPEGPAPGKSIRVRIIPLHEVRRQIASERVRIGRIAYVYICERVDATRVQCCYCCYRYAQAGSREVFAKSVNSVHRIQTLQIRACTSCTTDVAPRKIARLCLVFGPTRLAVPQRWCGSPRGGGVRAQIAHLAATRALATWRGAIQVVCAEHVSISQRLRSCMRAPAGDAAAPTIAFVRARTAHARELLPSMPRAEFASALQRRRLRVAAHAEDRAWLAAFCYTLASHARKLVRLVMHAEAAAASQRCGVVEGVPRSQGASLAFLRDALALIRSRIQPRRRPLCGPLG